MASLISQKTNLKSLRYGRDRVGGGDSNQPYIKSDPPDKASRLDRTGGQDFLLRGGSLSVSRSAKDVSRLTKMFFDFKSPNGPLFVAKQNLLSRTAVRTQASGLLLNEGAYLPTSTLLQAGGVAFGTHLLKQGVNPARNTSPNAGVANNKLLTRLGLEDSVVLNRVQSIIRDIDGLPVYAQNVNSLQLPEDNRLVQLKDSKIGFSTNKTQQGIFGDKSFSEILKEINPFKKGNSFKNIAKKIFSNNTKKLGISNNNGEILRYGGGPGSVLGIGQTSIKRYVYSVTSGFSADVSKGFFNVLGAGQGIEGRHIGNTGGSAVHDFRILLNKDPNTTRQNILSISPNYKTKNIEQRVNLGDPGRKTKNVTSYTQGLGALDKITAFPLYRSSKGDHGGNRNDLVKFSIGIVDNDFPDQKVYMHFRANLDSMDDQYTADWADFKYMGRGEKFYRYNGFSRTISMGWTVAAQSKEELIPMYHKLNFLASSLAPNYSKSGYMRGNLAVLTVGGYLFEQYGIITGLNYTVPQESPWEIGINDEGGFDNSVKELPHMIKVTGFNFIPIHDFRPGLQDNKYNNPYPDKKGIFSDTVSTLGDQRYIALTNGRTSNYVIPNISPLGSIDNLESPIPPPPAIPSNVKNLWINYSPNPDKSVENFKKFTQTQNFGS